jgi:DNA-binding winged helix-turn-helix (wHTH) protein/tetratricopeptide (TPR) repeat protein
MLLDQAISFGPYRLDPRGTLTRGKRRIRLAPKAFALLCCLARHKGRVVTKDELFDALWPDTPVGDAALVTCVQELRRALKDDARRPRYIETLHRRGYRFIAAELSATATSPLPQSFEHEQRLLVGRERELAQLDEALSLARTGDRQVVLVSGEPGIGKTTLVRAFLSRASQVPGLHTALGQSAENYGATEAYHPLLDALARACRGPWGEVLVNALDRHAPLWLAQMPALVGPSRLRALQRRTAGATPERMQRELTHALEAAAETPVVLCLEDLHWADVSTVDWLAAFARRPERVRLLILGTYRAGEASSQRRPIHMMRDELRRQGRSRDLVLGPLSSSAVGQYVAARFATRAEDSAALSRLAAEVHTRTEGSPLFVVGVLNELVARGVLVHEEAAWRVRDSGGVHGLSIPQDLRDSIERQIDRLEPVATRLLEIASVAGFEFSGAALAAGAGLPIGEIDDACSALCRSFQFLSADGTDEWPDGTVASRFRFVHALYREALYERLPAGRRVALHRRVGERLELGYRDQTAEIAPQLAMHFERGRDFPRAIRYFKQAGQTAVARSASHEAAAHFERALALLKSLPSERARDGLEASLRLALCVPLIAIHGMGSPLVEACAEQARALCERRRDSPGRFLAHRVLWNHSLMRNPVPATLDRARELIAFSEALRRPAELAVAQRALGCSLIYNGELREADRVLGQAIALADEIADADFAAYGEHPGMVCRVFGAWAKSLMGFPDAADRLCESGIEHARRRDDAHGLAYALVTSGMVHLFQRNADAAERVASEALALSQEYKLPQWVAFGHEIKGWALCRVGDAEPGLELLEEALARLRATGAKTHSSRILANLVENYLAAGCPDRARQRLDEALAHRDAHGEHYYAAELYRLQGLMLQREGAAPPETEASLKQSLAVARGQAAGLLAFRAAMTLGEYWAAQGKPDLALGLIEPLCSSPCERAGLPDLAAARALLEVLSAARARAKS